MKRLILIVAAITILGGGLGPAHAGVIFSTGFGSAVTTADRTATFDSIIGETIDLISPPPTDLSSYTENLLSITVPDTSFVGFNPFSAANFDEQLLGFHYGSGGNNDFVTIKGTDNAKMRGLEFRYGNGAEAGQQGQEPAFLIWKTFRDNIQTGNGFANNLLLGTIVGWSDFAGFDVLQVSGPAFADSLTTFGGLQTLALDDVRVQLSPASSGVVPEPASIAVWGIGALGMGFIARRKKKLATI